jgi:hypothetical protein
MDRVVNGGDVPSAELQQVWQNSTSTYVGLPIYEEFFRAVREANGDLHLGRTPANLRPGCQAGSTVRAKRLCQSFLR